MDYMNDILARLQHGEKVEDIAAELTKNINDANNQFQKEQEEAAARAQAEAEARRKNELAQEKIDYVDDILSCLISLMDIYEFDEADIQKIEDINGEEIVEVLDQMLPFFKKYGNFYLDLLAPKPDCANAKTEKAKKDIDPIEDFLNKFIR